MSYQTLNPNGRTKLNDTAKLIGVSSMTLRRWVSQDKFVPMIKVHGINFFSNADLIAWLESTANGTADERPCNLAIGA